LSHPAGSKNGFHEHALAAAILSIIQALPGKPQDGPANAKLLPGRKVFLPVPVSTSPADGWFKFAAEFGSLICCVVSSALAAHIWQCDLEGLAAG